MDKTPTIEDLTAQVDADMRAILESRQMPLYRMMSYHLGWEDKEGRPQLGVAGERNHGAACLAACHAVGGDIELALPAASSVELVNSFSQIHDDVQGGLPEHDNRETVWWIWGPAQAINAGDGMHALARLAIFRLQERGVPPATTFRAVQLLDEASLKLCEGRFRDLEAQERLDLSVDAYLRMASDKTGALYSCAMKLGAMIASADETVVKSLGECGVNIGVAAQIRGDLLELWPEGGGDGVPSPEVLNKKKLLPVVYALEKASLGEKRRLGDVYFKRIVEPDDVVKIRQVLDDLGARQYCEDLVGRYRAQAEASTAVDGIPSEGRTAIKAVADSLLGH